MSHSKGYTEAAKARGVTRQAIQQAERAAAGLCVDCGAAQKKDRTRCKACLDVRADRARAHRKKGTTDVQST